MSDNLHKPVLLFAYAGEDSTIGVEAEARAISQALSSVSDQFCKVEVPPFLKVEDVIDVFQKNRQRVSIFHYAGHADGAQLLLKTALGTGAGAVGLAAAVRGQSGLKLVFLNGCSTENQVQEWAAAGIPCVIATTRSINGEVAKNFAARFYHGLATGASIRTAYEEAVGEAVANVNGKMRLMFEEEDEQAQPASATSDRWPWFLKTAPGGEEAEEWNLPDAAGDPLALLPLPPGTGIPEDSPYPGLRRFTEKEAAVFFGRGQAVRKLYERVTSKSSAPIIMLHGQAGVGKSSILEAGLAPRLRTAYDSVPAYEVITIRIDPTRGLIDSFMLAFIEDATQDDGTLLLPQAAWIAKEKRLEKPLLVVLDQIEEAFTHAQIGASPDWDGFVKSLSEVFSAPETAPQGKLLLAFRTEWFSRVKKHLTGLRKSEVFLDTLDQAGIEEATIGPTLRKEVREVFPLSIESGLAERISNALLNDDSTSVAPTLQVLLKKLWIEASKKSRLPEFTNDLYKKHQATMGEFVQDQIESIKTHPKLTSAARKVITSGILIDFLECHITSEMTSRQRTLKEFIYGNPTASPPIAPLYPEREEVIKELRKLCIDHYLLIQPDFGNNEEPEPASRLAHDSLAIHIHTLYESSDAPGQRARRILEQRVQEWTRNDQIVKQITPVQKNHQETPPEHMATRHFADTFNNKYDPLSIVALEVIRQGKAGMRAWTPREVQIIKASRARRMIHFVSTAVVLLVLSVGFMFYRLDWYRQEIDRGLHRGADQFMELEELVKNSPITGKRQARWTFQDKTDANATLRSAMVLVALDVAEEEHYARVLDELRTIDQPHEAVEFQNLKYLLTPAHRWEHWRDFCVKLFSGMNEQPPTQSPLLDLSHAPATMAILIAAGQAQEIPREWYTATADPTVRTACIHILNQWMAIRELADFLGVANKSEIRNEIVAINGNVSTAGSAPDVNEELFATLCLALARYPIENLEEVLDVKAATQRYKTARTSILRAAARVLLAKTNNLQQFAEVNANNRLGGAADITVVEPDKSQYATAEWATLRFRVNKIKQSIFIDFVKIDPPGAQPAFWISSTEVPVGLFDGYRCTDRKSSEIVFGMPQLLEEDINLPAAYVTWSDALNLCNWLSHLAGQPQCYTETGNIGEFVHTDFENRLNHTPVKGSFRLPTPEEWETACAARSELRYHFGRYDKLLSEYDWYDGNSAVELTEAMRMHVETLQIKEVRHQCGEKLPNAWGLFDMHGNVREWVWNDSLEKDQGQELRGGSFLNKSHYCVTKDRTTNTLLEIANTEYGLRLVLDQLPN